MTPASRASAHRDGRLIVGTESERTLTGLKPLEGVLLYCDACGEFGHTFLTTDADGNYRFSGDLAHGGGIWIWNPISVLVQKVGYTVTGGIPAKSSSYPDGFLVTINISGDTAFDIVLTRR